MTDWPADHHGRDCKHCGRNVWKDWVGLTPPPGSCSLGALKANRCPTILQEVALAEFEAEVEGWTIPPEIQALKREHTIMPRHVCDHIERQQISDAHATASVLKPGEFLSDHPAFVTEK